MKNLLFSFLVLITFNFAESSDRRFYSSRGNYSKKVEFQQKSSKGNWQAKIDKKARKNNKFNNFQVETKQNICGSSFRIRPNLPTLIITLFILAKSMEPVNGLPFANKSDSQMQRVSELERFGYHTISPYYHHLFDLSYVYKYFGLKGTNLERELKFKEFIKHYGGNVAKVIESKRFEYMFGYEMDRIRNYVTFFKNKRGPLGWSMEDDRLKSVPREIKYLKNDLKRFSLARNKLKFLPLSMRELENLETLDLSDNKFDESSAHNLRDVLSRLYSLKQLNMTGNPIGILSQKIVDITQNPVFANLPIAFKVKNGFLCHNEMGLFIDKNICYFTVEKFSSFPRPFWFFLSTPQGKISATCPNTDFCYTQDEGNFFRLEAGTNHLFINAPTGGMHYLINKNGNLSWHSGGESTDEDRVKILDIIL